MRPVFKTAAIAAAAVLLASCAEAQPAAGPPGSAAVSSGPGAESHGGAVRDHVSFVDALRARGVSVTVVGQAQQPFLRGNGTQLRLDGAGLATPPVVESYDYNQADLGSDPVRAATEDADSIAADGMPKTVKIAWVATPHFYRAERLVVLYVGTDPTTQKLLSDLMGRQFAGG